MDTLRKVYETLSFRNVKTYIQSGNVIFTSKETNTDKLETKIASQIEKEFGFNIPMIVLTADSLKDIVINNPLADNEKSFLHIVFLSDEPMHFEQEVFIERNYLTKKLYLVRM